MTESLADMVVCEEAVEGCAQVITKLVVNILSAAIGVRTCDQF
jgi:hypothetical protein